MAVLHRVLQLPWRRAAACLVLVVLLRVGISWGVLGFVEQQRQVWFYGARGFVAAEPRLHRHQRFLEVPQIVWGLNNQKIALARAALTARYLNRTLVMPILSATLFHNASHPAQSIPFDSIFSFEAFSSRCGDFVSMWRRADLPTGVVAREVLKGSGRRWTAARDLMHLNECKRPEVEKHVLLRIVGKNPFLWADHWTVKDYVKIFKCLVLTDSILSDVRVVSSKLREASSGIHNTGPKAQFKPSYSAVHMRIEKDWMIHCRNTEKRAMEKEGKKLSICSSKMDIIKRVNKISILKRPALVYLAVADVLLDDSSLLDGWGKDLLPYEKKRLGVMETYAKHPYLVQAAMDYEICLQAEVFVGNSFSTFSSLVVMERTLEMPDSCESSYAYNLVTADGGPQPWLVDLSKATLSEISYDSTNVSCIPTLREAENV